MKQPTASRLTKRKPLFRAVPTLAVLPLLTAAMLCASLTTDWGTGLCYVALVPFAYALVAPTVPRATYAAAYLAGLVVHLTGMAWVIDCYRYDHAMGPYAIEWFWGGIWGGVLLVGTLALGRMIASRWHLPATLLLPTLWVTFEFIRHEMFALVAGIGFPWLKLGTALIDNQTLVQVADLGGEYLLSFLVAMMGGTLVDLSLVLSSKNWSLPQTTSQTTRMRSITVSCLLILSSIGYGQWRKNQSPGSAGPTVVLMGQLDLPPLLLPERLREATGDRHADLLLWPELAYQHAIRDLDAPTKNSARRHLTQSARELGSTLVIGCERIPESSRYNSLACADPRDGFQGCYDKIHLVPSVEATIQSDELPDASPFSYQQGHDLPLFRLPTETGVTRFAPAICYDLCFGQHFRKSRAQEVDFLVQIGAEGQDKSGDVARLMLRYAKLRAIENRRALVRNANFGHSALIDGSGVVRAVLTTDPINLPVWLGTVPIDTRQSFYLYWGDWVAYASCFATLALALVPLKKDVRPTCLRPDALGHVWS